MSDVSRLLMAVGFSIAIMLGWDFYLVSSGRKIHHTSAQTKAEPLINHDVDVGEYCTMSRSDAISLTAIDRLALRSDKIEGSVYLKGLKIDDVSLLDYKATLENDSINVSLLSPKSSHEPYFLELGWGRIPAEAGTLPDENSLWIADQPSIEPNIPVKFSWKNEKGTSFLVTIEIDKAYMFTIEQKVFGIDGSPINIEQSTKIVRKKDKKHESSDNSGAVGVEGSRFFDHDYDSLRKKGKVTINDFALNSNYNKMHKWFGFTDKYWLVAIIPLTESSSELSFEFTGKNDIYNAVHTMPVNGKFSFFAGAKELKVLDDYANELNIFAFDRSVDFGIFYFIAKPMLQLLLYINKATSNLGLAIMLLTIIVRLAMFPIANKSFYSMHKMRKLQPQIDAIKKKCGDDAQALNKEVMALFQKSGINPMSGCLPILAQIPVFFALYKILYISIDMRQAPFYGWVHDLSAPDPINVFNILKLINLNTPALLNVGLWPILFGLTMFLQQRSVQTANNPHASAMKVMPYILVFMFSSFPVGLIIYWSWNNILSILQQKLMNRIYR